MPPTQTSLFSSGEPVNLLPFNGEVLYYPSFFGKTESGRYLQSLQTEIDWKQEPVVLFGKQIMQPRLTAWYGSKGYSYSGITMQPQPFAAVLPELKQAAEAMAKVEFNSCLLNNYRNGNDSMGWHRDNEKNLGKSPVIASLSFGAARKFQFRNYEEKTLIKTLFLEHGSLLLMRGKTQQCWEHRLPKQSKSTEPRINITFRSVI